MSTKCVNVGFNYQFLIVINLKLDIGHCTWWKCRKFPVESNSGWLGSKYHMLQLIIIQTVWFWHSICSIPYTRYDFTLHEIEHEMWINVNQPTEVTVSSFEQEMYHSIKFDIVERNVILKEVRIVLVNGILNVECLSFCQISKEYFKGPS